MSDRTAAAGTGSTAPVLRVRPPHPLTPSARLVVLAMVLVALVVASLVLRAAVRDDAARGIVGQDLDALLPPLGATVDPFVGTGPLALGDAITWDVAEGSWTLAGGTASSAAAGADVALADTGGVDVVLDAKVVVAEPGGGLVLADGPGDRVELVVDESGEGWQVVRTRGGTRQLLQLVPGPTADVVVRVVRRPDLLTVGFDGEDREITLAGGPLTGTAVGLVAAGPGTRFDRFAYLPLDPR